MQLRHILTLTKWFRSRGPTCVFLVCLFFLMTNSDNVRLLLFPHLVEINIILHLVWTVLLQMKEQSDECDCVVFNSWPQQFEWTRKACTTALWCPSVCLECVCVCVCIILSFSLSLGSHCQLVSFLQKSESMSVSSGLSRSGPHLGQPHCSSLYLLLNFLSVWRGMSALLSVPLLCQCVLVLTISDLWESLSYIGFFVIID